MRPRRPFLMWRAVFVSCTLSVLACQSATRPTGTDASGKDASGIEASEGADPSGLDAALIAATVNHALKFSSS